MTMILCINRYTFPYHVFLFVSFPHASKDYIIYKKTFDIYGNRYEIAWRYFIQKRAKLFTQKYYTTVTYNLALRKKSSFPLKLYSVNVTQQTTGNFSAATFKKSARSNNSIIISKISE